MIKYALVCARAHEFESWFRDSAAFDTQARRGLIACPMCGSVNVAKAIMSPAISAARKKERQIDVAAAAPPADASDQPPAPVALLDERHRRLRAMIREVRADIMEKSDNVGRRFPQEARRIHGGEAPPRSIYGEASGEEIQELLEDGVKILPMPRLPEERN